AKQFRMLHLVMRFGTEARRAIEAGVYLKEILKLEVRDRIARAKYHEESQLVRLNEIETTLLEQIETLIREGGTAHD
ncbi:MAG: V-type ATP synthase subunit A, partial [Bacillota bacterium]|nr:V-type ATP synthase subunit A [Bacillota bacterium]